MMYSQKGFTLIEMVMVIIILAIISSMLAPLLIEGLNTFSQEENIVNANWQGQIAMARMSRDIASIRSSSDLTTIATTNLAFTDSSNNTISYSLNGTDLTLTQNGTGAVLANGIQSLTFTYFDKNGVSTATATSVRFIQIALNVIQNNVNYTLTTMIYPRNLT